MNEATAATAPNVRLFMKMLSLSQQIIRAGEEENVGAIAQLVLQRGEVMEAVKNLPYSQIPPEEKTEMAIVMAEVNLIEIQVQEKLALLTRKLENKLGHVHESREAIGNYKIISPSRSNHSSQA